MVKSEFLHKPAVVFTMAFMLVSVSSWLLTNRVFPLVTALDPYSRDTSTTVQAAVLLLLAILAMRFPHLLRRWMFISAPFACSVVGTGMLILGLASSNAVVSSLGLTVSVMAPVSLNVLLGCSIVHLDGRQIGLSVVVGMLAAYALRFVLALVPDIVALLLYSAVALVAIAITARSASSVIDAARIDESPSRLAITNPFSFLPLDHQVFICLFLFRVAYGFGLTFGEVGNLPLMTAFAGIVMLVVLLAYRLLRGRLPRPDALFYLAVMLVVAGFLFVGSSESLGFSLVGNLLEAGSSCFTLLFWLVLGVMGKKNPRGSLFLFTWTGFLLAMGVLLGALLGRVGNALMLQGNDVAIIYSNVLVLGYIAYTMVVLNLRGFSFDKTIQNLEDSPQILLPQEPSSSVDDVISGMEGEYGFTPRECEIFELLARGRTGTYIQNQLCVSYNTVKTHVGHIYDKMGIHNHQELINSVESRIGESRV